VVPMKKLAFCLGLAAWLAHPPARAADLPSSLASATATMQGAYTFLHENPELGKKEFKAHDYLIDALKGLGFTQFVTSAKAPTAVIAVLDSGQTGPVIALRAEMDARPLEAGAVEPASHAPRSHVDGLMHLVGGWRGGDPIESFDMADYDLLHDLLVKTTMYVTRAFHDALAEGGDGGFARVDAKFGEDAVGAALADLVGDGPLPSFAAGVVGEEDGPLV
jgi:hypothetical protein